jgi:uncharacterized membrane protein (DUF106 family)
MHSSDFKEGSLKKTQTIARFAEDLSRRAQKLKQLQEEKENSERKLMSEQFRPT